MSSSLETFGALRAGGPGVTVDSHHLVPKCATEAVDTIAAAFEASGGRGHLDEYSWESFKNCWRENSGVLLKLSDVHIVAGNRVGEEKAEELVSKDRQEAIVGWENGEKTEEKLQGLYTAAIRLLDIGRPVLRRVGGLFVLVSLYFSLPSELVRSFVPQKRSVLQSTRCWKAYPEDCRRDVCLLSMYLSVTEELASL